MSYRMIYGDMLSYDDVDAMCHQDNCLTVKAHGLSLKIAEKFPWADIYKYRVPLQGRNLAIPASRGKPGSIKVFSKESFPSVICLLGQWDYGSCDKLFKRNIPPYTDTREKRLEWFQQSLNALGETDFRKLSFPFKVGCGMAGGIWSEYFSLIKQFTITYKKEVVIVVPRLNKEPSKISRSLVGEEFEFFWGKNNSVFSQWHNCTIVIDGVKYNCAEQYMMHQKAVLMGDKESAQQILKSKNPMEQKRLGRQVKHFKQALWDKECQSIVKRGNLEKFKQNKKLAETLIATYPKTLVEASPFDKVWGIGLTSSDERAKNRKQWKGQNLLGFILTEVRNELMSKH